MLSVTGYILIGVIMNKLNILSGWWLVLYISGWILDLLGCVVEKSEEY